MQRQGEPSVEEILESIKKVIARESAAASPEVEPASREEADEILELDEDAMIALADEEGTQGRFAEEETARPLTAEEKSSAIAENFAALAMLAKPGREPQIVRSGETSLEGLVREMLRPMLAKWLDDNLPPMVEDLVKAEIARIAGKKP
ncbi:DUF2497 domain-containing protein [Qipengyuania sp.]|uniref:DUF2497 domain-containing protein n=1 Tax=Qipengyuania sp. TaxID=2004515 RepID=UPI0035C85302